MTDFTPTEELILDVLAARYRTGEHEWSLSRRHGKALASLKNAGLITTRPHNADPTFLYASLTENGQLEALSDTYAAPAEETNPYEVAIELLRKASAEWECPHPKPDGTVEPRGTGR